MSNKITVGCKLPNGLLLDVGGKTVTLNGFMKGSNIIGGYGITENVDEELFDAWMLANKEMSVVKKGLIFKQKNPKEAAAQASDTKENKSGLEQIDPDKEPDIDALDNEGEVLTKTSKKK